MSTQSSPHVLLVEDDDSVRELLHFHLETAGFTVSSAGTAMEAEELVHEADAIVLDWMLPDVSGVDWLARQRAAGDFNKPVLMLTARATEVDKVRGLESGADDYLTKPFSNAELVARLRALLRRVTPPAVVRVGDLNLDFDQGVAQLEGASLSLTRREFELLVHLARHPGRVFSRTDLLDNVWGEDFLGTERTVDQHVSQLRAILGAGWIETVRGRGYRLTLPE